MSGQSFYVCRSVNQAVPTTTIRMVSAVGAAQGPCRPAAVLGSSTTWLRSAGPADEEDGLTVKDDPAAVA